MGDDDNHEGKVYVIRCQVYTDGEQCCAPAIWKMGTWWACDKHAEQYMLADTHEAGRGFSVFGSAYRGSMCIAEEFYIDGGHEGMGIWVSQEAYDESHE